MENNFLPLHRIEYHSPLGYPAERQTTTLDAAWLRRLARHKLFLLLRHLLASGFRPVFNTFCIGAAVCFSSETEPLPFSTFSKQNPEARLATGQTPLMSILPWILFFFKNKHNIAV